MADSKISYSELCVIEDCLFRHKLTYLDKLPNTGNEYSAFGTTIHSSAQKQLLTEALEKTEPVPPTNWEEVFLLDFRGELKKLRDAKVDLNKGLCLDLKDQGLVLIDKILPALKSIPEFKDYVLENTEEELYEPIKDFETNIKFKGYIDLVLKVGEKYYILDWKTSTWGWDARTKSSPRKTYQLTLYKHFFCQKHNIDPKNVETYFALLKRTAKKNHVEIFRVTSGPKKVENAVKWMETLLKRSQMKFKIKNKANCRFCPYYKKECK